MTKYYVDPDWCRESPEEAAAELERLHKWCDELEAELKRVRDERDALAASVEDGKKLVLELLVDDTTDDATHLIEWAEVETSDDPFTRLKAEWQAEALGRVLAESLAAVEADTVRAHLRNAMRKLRRQAEGGE